MEEKCVSLTMSNIVDAVQVASPFLVVHVLPLATYDLEGRASVEELARFPATQVVTLNCR